MQPTTINNAEHFTLEGPFGWPVAAFVLLLLLALFTFSLWRERFILGQKNTVLFWILRAAALAAVVWMILAPANIRVETATTRQSVAIITDVSGSMRTIDPPGTADEIHWVAAQNGDGDYAAIKAADEAVVAAGIAERHLQTAAAALTEHQRESIVVESTDAANAALDRVRENVAAVENQYTGPVSQNAGTRKQLPLAARILKSLDGPESETFSKLAAALSKGRTPSQKGWRESLPDLQHRVAGIRRQLNELARDVAADETQRADRNTTNALTSFQQTPRLTRATRLLTSLHDSVLTPLQEKADVRISSFDQSLTRVTSQNDPATEITSRLPAADEEGNIKVNQIGTDLSAVLEQLIRDRLEQPLAAAFIFTDVGHNRSTAVNPRDVAADLKGTPIYIVPIGNTQHVRDVILQSVFVPNVAMRNDDIVIEATLQAHDCEGESCFVQLMQDGEAIDQRVVEIDSGFATRKIRFEQKMSEVGVQQFQLAISPLEGELTDKNNFDDFEVNVTRSDIKILLADELPRWEYRYLAQLFRRDPKVECDELLFQPRQIATGRRQESGTFPTTVEEWDQYDVVILGDLAPNHLSAASQESLIEYLKDRGGTVVLIAGSSAKPQAYVDHPLESIVPVSPVADDQKGIADSGYAFHVTKVGRDHNALMIGDTDEATRNAWNFVNQVSPIYEVNDWRQPRASAHTLISAVPRGTLDPEYAAKQNALLCWQPVGRGMTVYLAAPDTWRLRLLRGDRLHYRFWGQLLRWAIAADLSAGSEAVRIKPDKSRYTSNEPVQIVVRLTDKDGVPVVAEGLQAVAKRDDDQQSIPLVADAEIPGQYRGDFRNLAAGVYSVQAVGADVDKLLQDSEQEASIASFTVQAELPVELLDTRCDRALAQQIANITGGQVLPPTAVEEVLSLTNLEPEVTERIETTPLWLQWKYLWLVFGCLQTEWIVRKWKGLS